MLNKFRALQPHIASAKIEAHQRPGAASWKVLYFLTRNAENIPFLCGIRFTPPLPIFQWFDQKTGDFGLRKASPKNRILLSDHSLCFCRIENSGVVGVPSMFQAFGHSKWGSWRLTIEYVSPIFSYWKYGNMVILHCHVSFRWGGYIKVHQVQRFHQKMIWKCGNQDDVVDGLLSFLPGTHTWRTGVSTGLVCTCWTNGCTVNFQSEHLTFNLIIRNGRGDMSFQKGEEKPGFLIFLEFAWHMVL